MYVYNLMNSMCHDIRGGKQFEGRSEQLLVYVVHGEHAGKIHNLWEIITWSCQRSNCHGVALGKESKNGKS